MPDNSLEAAIACTRFAMGARPGDIEAAQSAPRSWLKTQMTPPKFGDNLPTSSESLTLYTDFRDLKKQLDVKMQQIPAVMSQAEYKDQLRQVRPQKYAIEFVNDSLRRSVSADNSLAWRLLDFFSNHFSVSATGGLMNFLAPTLEREAIAPHLFGHFEDMLVRVEMHPAMIIYLNNEKSFGPNSKLARRSKKKGLNENLAREILELHTLGVRGGYHQQDVIELAKAISGWSITSKREKVDNRGFMFRSAGHEPGKRNVVGKFYSDTGIDQGKSILKDLAVHPSTAQFICAKLVKHFISDIPDKTVVDRLSKVWINTKGNLTNVIAALIDSTEAWQSSQRKFKSPREFIISSGRMAKPKRWRKGQAMTSFSELGQKPFSAGSPAGFGDTSASWDGADALHARIEWSSQYSKLLTHDAITLAKDSLGNLLKPSTRLSLSRAESQTQARTLLLMSPEFLRR